jgi:SNF family Na+-dependent transporter
VGWMMKISHLRKAINFSSEGFYNIWRIAVRIILPLAILMALVAYIGQFI